MTSSTKFWVVITHAIALCALLVLASSWLAQRKEGQSPAPVPSVVNPHPWLAMGSWDLVGDRMAWP